MSSDRLNSYDETQLSRADAFTRLLYIDQLRPRYPAPYPTLFPTIILHSLSVQRWVRDHTQAGTLVQLSIVKQNRGFVNFCLLACWVNYRTAVPSAPGNI